ncbi:MAG TPA: DUF4139 domain-containing protein [Polyangiaceae bacterium]|nr:DUF4139 domain-containing protein [Polyangiaceae bacterium]
MGSRIDRVTVFRRGARVERVLDVDGEVSEVRFVGLPLVAEDGSVRARVLDGEGLACDVRVGLEVPEADAALAPAIDEALEKAGDEATRCRAEVSRLQSALARLDALKIVPRPQPRDNEPPLPIPLESRQRLLALRAAEEERLGTALTSANESLRAAERKLVEETDRHARATTARNAKEHELRKVATVSLASVKKGAKVLLEYAVPGATWSPSYVLTLSGEKAKLGMRAMVAQHTGEDWTGVSLRLSTAEADAWVELPELAKARIGRAQPARPKLGYREPPEGARALYADYDQVAGPPASFALPVSEIVDELAAAEEETTPTDKTESIAYGAPPAGGAMPPAPMAASVTMMTTRGSPAKKSAGIAGAILAAPAALVAAPVMALGRAFGEAGARDHGRAFAAPPPAQQRAPAPARRREASAELLEEMAPESWELAAESLSFSRLRMRAPGDAARGELVAIAQSSVYVEALGVRVQVDVVAAIRVAFHRAEVDDDALPKGYELAHTTDAYDYAYNADLPCDVASDGASRAITVADWDAKTTLRHVAVPREAQQVYRLLEIDSPIDAALLSGPLDVYEGSGEDVTYRTTTRMPETPPRGRVEIGLGVEPAIKIARTTTFQEESTGLLGGSLALVHKVSVELRNLLPRAVTVEVRERVPVMRKDDSEVKVEVGSVDPAWESWDQEQSLRGGHVWKAAIDSGATRTLAARYTIKISGKHELVGGNRRES